MERDPVDVGNQKPLDPPPKDLHAYDEAIWKMLRDNLYIEEPDDDA